MRKSGLSILDEWKNKIPTDLIDSFKGEEPPIIFLGSGFSKEAIPPLDTGSELSEKLRKELQIEDHGESLADLFQFMQNLHVGSKKKIIEWLKKNLLYGKSQPGGAYRLLLELPSKIFLNYQL